jgi:hypothetical protein
VTTAVGVWSTDKTVALTASRKHNQVPSPIAPHFVAPGAAANLTFGPIALAASVARTGTTREDAPAALLDALQRSTLPLLETTIADGPMFELSANFQYLGDTERAFLAARVGAGITDLYMNALGYTWRANAICLSSSLDPHADFIYEGGNSHGYGVVLAEAHGSFAKTACVGSVKNQAKQKYMRQVKPYLAVNSPYGKVIHGYSIAFGSAPSRPGAFLSVSETRIATPRKKPVPPAAAPLMRLADRYGLTPTAIALAAHRSNFLLIGSKDVVEWIDWIRSDGRSPESKSIGFMRFRYAGRRYLVPWSSLWWFDLPVWRGEFLDHPDWRHVPPGPLRPLWRPSAYPGRFALEETAGKAFLQALTGIIRDERRLTPPSLELPSISPVGFGFRGEGVPGLEEDSVASRRDKSRYQYALFRDGLALLADPSKGQPDGITVWQPKDGILSQ